MKNCYLYDVGEDNRTHKIVWGNMSREEIGNIQSLFTSRGKYEMQGIHMLLDMLYE